MCLVFLNYIIFSLFLKFVITHRILTIWSPTSFFQILTFIILKQNWRFLAHLSYSTYDRGSGFILGWLERCVRWIYFKNYIRISIKAINFISFIKFVYIIGYYCLRLNHFRGCEE
ncbi:hypothetical protein BpHYR1_027074 [Brachionus plicatilis]|uniref:Uncharacterized protein n=1 Tax=Brachionus plicatilis TaxID=10195 RepID=A0A3M7QZF0_BRAPC|nr:hypothetical protein BpHYR1_027074 [Brachionus plicatilis]